MIDSYSLNNFCDGWLRKAESYRTGRLADPFDEFFTLFVVYNRVYVEIGKILIFQKHHSVSRYLSQRRFARKNERYFRPVRPLPDRVSAIELASAYLMKNGLVWQVEASNKREIIYLVNAIECGTFYFNYDYENDAPDLEKDQKLAAKIKSGNFESVLELIYMARCNMFHGSKEFHDIQRQLLSSMSSILRNISNLALPCLVQDINQHNNQR